MHLSGFFLVRFPDRRPRYARRTLALKVCPFQQSFLGQEQADLALAPHLCHGKAQLYLHYWKVTTSCWSQIVTSLLKYSNWTLSLSCLVQFSISTKESLWLSVPHLSAFAKWCSEFPVMEWEGKASWAGSLLYQWIHETMKGLFFSGSPLLQGHNQSLKNKQTPLCTTFNWKDWLASWNLRDLGQLLNSFMMWNKSLGCVLSSVPSQSDCQLCTDKPWVLLNIHTLLSTLQPLSHLRLLGVLVTHIITLYSSISYGGKSHEKYLVCAFVYIKVIGMERCHTVITVLSFGGRDLLLQCAHPWVECTGATAALPGQTHSVCLRNRAGPNLLSLVPSPCLLPAGKPQLAELSYPSRILARHQGEHPNSHRKYLHLLFPDRSPLHHLNDPLNLPAWHRGRAARLRVSR